MRLYATTAGTLWVLFKQHLLKHAFWFELKTVQTIQTTLVQAKS
jgi:hypothetical protein